jgi:hypothetical protein
MGNNYPFKNEHLYTATKRLFILIGSAKITFYSTYLAIITGSILIIICPGGVLPKLLINKAIEEITTEERAAILHSN